MKIRSTWLLLLAFCLLVTALVVVKIQRRDHEVAGGAQDDGRRQAMSEDPKAPDAPQINRSSRDRSDAAYLQSLVDLRREFDEILPAKHPDYFSSLCDANLKPGEALILGGFKTADGGYEFNALQVAPDADAAQPGSYRISTRSFVLSPEQCDQQGLSELLTSAPMRIQKSVVRPADALPSTITGSSMVMTLPAVSTQTNISASISMSAGNQTRAYSYLAEPGAESGSIRLRTRIESPGNAAP
ncbi:MAG TPA: hypothetical protein VFY13_08595 [Luteolibacter sp.]|nr:hypothetical protein [Luteolibacter sp.]